jgi:hypothetical protein
MKIEFKHLNLIFVYIRGFQITKQNYGHNVPITVATRSKAWTDFARSNANIVG